jgi:hypothetical protein
VLARPNAEKIYSEEKNQINFLSIVVEGREYIPELP